MDRKMMAASTSMLLLKLLEEEDLYGYQMIRRLEARSDNVFSLKEGTMYPVLHALEVCTITGRPYSSLRTGRRKERPFQIMKIGLNRPREELYDRINRRVDQMMADGLLEEARRVYPYRALNSLNTVGYKELFKYIDGEWTLPFAVEKIKQNSRISSRKQMTWFKRDADIRWFHPEQEAEILAYLRGYILE